jgi:tetratricopeptide (TPR) repeat protein
MRLRFPVWVLAVAFAAYGQDSGDLQRAISLEQNGQADQAIALLQTILKRNPRSAEAHNWLGVAYLQKNSLSTAADEFRQAVKLKPDFVRAYNNLGSTLAQAGDILQGIQILQEGLKHGPDDFQLRLNLAMALRSKGDPDAALELFRALLRDHADSPELRYQYGQALRQKGDLEHAIEAFEQAVELNPELQQGYYGLGQALKQLAARANRPRPSGNPPEFLKSGTEALARGDFAAARDAAAKAIAGGTASPEAYHLLGFALWYAGDRAKAGPALDESLRLNPAAADVCSFRGMTYRELGDLDQARRMLQRAIALDPQRPLSYLDLAVVFLRQEKLESALGQFEAGLNLPAAQNGLRDLDPAITELRRAIAKHPGNSDAHRVLGRLLGAAGADASQVIAAFQQAIKLRPDNAEAHNSLGLVYVQTGQDEKAIAAFRQAIKLRPDYADAHQNLGAVLTTSDTEEAVRELEMAIKLQPGLLKAQYNLALAYDASPSHGAANAIEQLRKLLAAEPAYPRAEFALGRFLLRQAKAAEAVDHLRRAVEQNPESGEARYQLGLALSRSGHPDEGAAEIRKSRELITASENREAAALDLAEAKAAIGKGDTATAAAKARKVLEFQPAAAEAQAILNAVAAPTPAPTEIVERHIRAGEFEDAERLLNTFLAKDPKSAWGWYALGYSLYGQRKIGDSIKALAQSLQLDVNNADAHKVLGRDLMIIGRFDAAKIEFEQGKRLNPKSAEMPYNLGKLYSIQDNWAQARREFETAIQLDPSYMEAYDGLGFAFEALGEDTAAVANYKKAIEMNEARHAGFSSPYVNISALSNRTGDHDTALTYARRGLDANPNSDRALFQMAKAYEYQGDLKAALDALHRAIAINGRTASYFYVLSTVYRKLGNSEESRKAMETFSRLDRESNELEQKRRDFLREDRPESGRHE